MRNAACVLRSRPAGAPDEWYVPTLLAFAGAPALCDRMWAPPASCAPVSPALPRPLPSNPRLLLCMRLTATLVHVMYACSVMLHHVCYNLVCAGRAVTKRACQAVRPLLKVPQAWRTRPTAPVTSPPSGGAAAAARRAGPKPTSPQTCALRPIRRFTVCAKVDKPASPGRHRCSAFMQGARPASLVGSVSRLLPHSLPRCDHSSSCWVRESQDCCWAGSQLCLQICCASAQLSRFRHLYCSCIEVYCVLCRIRSLREPLPDDSKCAHSLAFSDYLWCRTCNV